MDSTNTEKIDEFKKIKNKVSTDKSIIALKVCIY